MKIILIRHQERYEEKTFDVHLTEHGLEMAKTLPTQLEPYFNQYDVKAIYSSPFIRCLETAQPLLKALDTQVCVEYGLLEYFSLEDGFSANNYRNLRPEEEKTYRVRGSYTSRFKPYDMVYPEEPRDVLSRTRRLIYALQHSCHLDYLNVEDRYFTEKEPCIVCFGHMTVLNAMSYLLTTPPEKEEPFESYVKHLDQPFPVGSFRVHDLK